MKRPSTRLRFLIGLLIATVAGLGLSVAEHHFNWSEHTTFLVAIPVVAVVVLTATPFVLLGRSRRGR